MTEVPASGGCGGVTPVHDFAVSLLADHVETSGDWPFGASAKAIFNMWKLVPSHRGTLKSSFESICENFTEKADLVAICEGIFESDIQIRYLAGHSLCLSPLLQRSAVPASEDVTFPFWMALHDVDGSVQQAAQQLWKLYGHNLPEDFGLGLRDYLNLPHMSSVKAACASLRDGIMIHPKMCKPVIEIGIKVILVVMAVYLVIFSMGYKVFKLLPMNAIKMVFGAALCFFGGTYYASIAAIEAFRIFGWETLRANVKIVIEQAKLY